MRNFSNAKRTILGLLISALVLVGTAITLSAQNETREYRDWQRAQQRAEQIHQNYLRTRSSWDYQQWQSAERMAQEQYRRYQQTASNYNTYNNRYDNDRSINYDSRYNTGYNNGYNSYNNTSNTYRLYRDGSYYSTDSRGAELLRTAVRNGYSQGYNQGMRDRRGGRGYDFRNDSMYRSGVYGYQSYVARDQYQHYFQQGFERGYEDGYYGRNQYGIRSGNGFSILGNILDSIINISH